MAIPNRSLIPALAAISCLLPLTGCGSGTGAASLLPGASKPSNPSSTAPSGPTLGYVFSSTDGTLRAMLGVRGSAQMSASIVPAGVYVAGEASTANSTALLEDASGSLFSFALPGSQPIHVADNLPANVSIVFSASGKTAIAYRAGGASIALISGLPSTPQVQTIATPAIASAVVSDAGTIVIASQGSPVSVGPLSSAGQFSRVTTLAALGGLSFLPGSEDLLVADASANTVSIIRNIGTAPAMQPLSIAGLNQPIAVAASQDKKWALIANGGDANIFRVDLTTGTPATRLLCACQPTQLTALSGGGAFRVNTLYNGPLWTVDLMGSTPQLLFVPAIAKGTP